MLEIRNLKVEIGGREIVMIDALDLGAGERLGLVGESGSGKTMSAMSAVGLQPQGARVTGSVKLGGRELIGLSDGQLAQLRGAEVGVVFQDPLRSLNPLMRVGSQVAEPLRLHAGLSKAAAMEQAVALLEEVRLPDPQGLARRYPHQLSGGQRQRVLIAMAIACSPKLLIADEPTTALDVTVQKDILELLLRLSRERGMALLFVSHNLGVIRAVSEKVAVLYGGHLMEIGPVDEVLRHPGHRYTEALVGANPGRSRVADLPNQQGQHLTTIEGAVPAAGRFPSGCRFRNRCAFSLPGCAGDIPQTRLASGHLFRCLNPAIEGGADVAAG
ncbi:ATP-binding cassette domain-containing protein [Devosia sp. D6-9]|nr:ATP-binding cassette domain-containing protein [Devosia sp. D6-9]